MRIKGLSIGMASLLALGACAVAPPTSPRVMALPGPGKTFEAFQGDDAECRNYAYNYSGGPQGAQQATNNAVGTAIAGTVVGAGVGAALGSLSGQAGAGALVGGSVGALAGGSAGANSAAYGAADLQQRYDMVYAQCMYGHGDRVENPPGGYPLANGPYPAAYPYGYPGYAAPAVVVAPTIGVGVGYGGYGYRHRYWR